MMIIQPPTNKKGQIKQCNNCKHKESCISHEMFGNVIDANCYEESGKVIKQYHRNKIYKNYVMGEFLPIEED